ncbi:MAG: alpha,alpha-trehalose-phosphate synthase, partial [Caballeronia sp.]
MVGMSEAIGVALSMPLAERKQRYETNMVALRKYNLGVWRDSFLADLKGVQRATEG